MDKIEPINEGGVWKCPICGFTAMSKRVVQSHIERTHKEVKKEERKAKKEKKAKKDKEKAKVWSIGGVPLKKVRIHLRGGNSLIGEVVGVTTYEIVLKPNSHVSDYDKIVIFKHAVDYIEVIE